MATAEARIIVKTETAGWYEDPATGKKTRKQDGDRIMTSAEYAQLILDAEPAREVATDQEKNMDEAATVEAEVTTDDAPKQTAQRPPTAKPDAEIVTLTTGKRVTGKTIEIRCAWVDPDKRTPEQVALFEGDPRQISYDSVKTAAGTKRSAFPDGTKRTIKKQDAFQVRFSPENQIKWRAELKRRKTKARREAARAAAATT